MAGTEASAAQVAAIILDRPAPASSTALVSSSTKSGTPSVRSTISSTMSRLSALREVPPEPLLTSAGRLNTTIVTCGWPIQGRLNSGRKVTMRSTGRPRMRSIVRSNRSRPSSRSVRRPRTQSASLAVVPKSRAAGAGLERLLPPALWREVVRLVVGCGDRQQCSEKPISSRKVLLAPEASQFLEADLGRVVAFEAGRTPQLADDRVQAFSL